MQFAKLYASLCLLVLASQLSFGEATEELKAEISCVENAITQLADIPIDQKLFDQIFKLIDQKEQGANPLTLLQKGVILEQASSGILSTFEGTEKVLKECSAYMTQVMGIVNQQDCQEAAYGRANKSILSEIKDYDEFTKHVDNALACHLMMNTVDQLNKEEAAEIDAVLARHDE